YAPTALNTSRSTEVRKPALFRTRKGGGNFHTVGYKHKLQLSTLMSTLQNTHPHFVRCILPNDRKRPGEIQPELVLHQLRCNGVLEGIRICRVGYPNRLTFEQFREQYKLLCSEHISQETDHRKACEILVEACGQQDGYQLGKTKIFFKAGILGEFEKRRDIKLSEIVTKIQAACMGWMTRRRLVYRHSQEQLIRTIQRNSRVYISMQQSRLWKVFYRRKELQYTFGSENAIQKKMENLEQVLTATQEQLQELSEENHQLIEKQEAETTNWRAAILDLEKEKENRAFEYANAERALQQAEQKYTKSQKELEETKRLSEQQAVLLSKMHKDIQEESKENEELMIQCDSLCTENQELQEKVQLLQENQNTNSALQEELDYNSQENKQLRQNLKEIESQYAKDREAGNEELARLNDSLWNRQRDHDKLRLEYDILQRKMEQMMGERDKTNTKMYNQLNALENSLTKESDEKKHFQRKNAQLERDVETLTRLVQSEAKESRARAER
ncbi:P-loop containing nucleoside triphosphate hydrolase protein, partial [Sporodiniella umbellata]